LAYRGAFVFFFKKKRYPRGKINESMVQARKGDGGGEKTLPPRGKNNDDYVRETFWLVTNL